MAEQQRPPHPTASAHDAEQLLSGRKPANTTLGGVHGALNSLSAAAHEYPSRETADAQARVLSQAALEAAPAGVLARQHRSLTKRSSTMKTRTRIASAAGAALALILGTTGAAMAAEETVPGDTLYDFKIALEELGVTEGGFAERLSEATVLSERGDDAGALMHLADSLEKEEAKDTEGSEGTEDESTEGADDLRKAAEAVLSEGSEDSLEVRTRVAEMLQWMATTDAEGRDFGQGVAERANAISGESQSDRGENESDSQEGVADADKGNRPENAGPPEGKGPGSGEGNGADKSSQADKDDTPSGRPENAGPPEGKGRP